MDANSIELRIVTADELETVEGGSLRGPNGRSGSIMTIFKQPAQLYPGGDDGGE